MLILRRIFLVFILSTLILCSLTACAFKLRGQNELPQGLRVMYLATDNPYGTFELNVRKTLRSSGITLVDSPEQANVILRLGKPDLSSNQGTVGNSNQSRIYNVLYTDTFSVEDTKGKTLIMGWLRASRNLTLSANQLIESNNQLPLLEQEMQRDLISQLFNQLTSEQLAQALQAKPAGNLR